MTAVNREERRQGYRYVLLSRDVRGVAVVRLWSKSSPVIVRRNVTDSSMDRLLSLLNRLLYRGQGLVTLTDHGWLFTAPHIQAGA